MILPWETVNTKPYSQSVTGESGRSAQGPGDDGSHFPREDVATSSPDEQQEHTALRTLVNSDPTIRLSNGSLHTMVGVSILSIPPLDIMVLIGTA